jgi:hypothetical protein
MAGKVVRVGKSVYKNFVYGLPDNELEFICSRLHRQYQDDLAEICNYVSSNDSETLNPIKSLFENSNGYEDFYSIIDDLKFSATKEYDRRGYNIMEVI